MLKRVCVVDDDLAMLRTTNRALTCKGWQVQVTSLPIEPSKTLGEIFLLDYEPYGPEMMKRCQAAGLPFVVMSGNFPAVELLLQQGIMALSKPWLTKDLSAALEATLDAAKGVRL
jgi:DNA-binding NtrC family response regulator